MTEERRSQLFLVGWILVAVVVHLVFGFGADSYAKWYRSQNPIETREKTGQMVEFKPIPAKPKPKPKPEPKPEPEPEEVAAQEPEPPKEPEETIEPVEKPEPKPEPKPKRKVQKRKLAKETPPPKPDDEFEDFVDAGAFTNSTSTQGGMAVQTGTDPYGDPDRAKPKGKRPRPRPKGNDDVDQAGSAEGTAEARTPVKRANLSKKAKPNVRYNQKIKADYPEGLRRAGEEANVVAIVTVGPDGKVDKVKIVSKTPAAFNDAAIEAIKKFKFAAALNRDGKSVTSEVRIVYKFRLDDA